MAMHKALHPRDGVERLYVSRKDGGRGLNIIEDSVGASIKTQRLYTKNTMEDSLQLSETILRTGWDNRMTITREKMGRKQLYGRLKRLIDNISHEKTWTWVRKDILGEKQRSLQITAQNDPVTTKTRLDKSHHNSKCRLCGDRGETINHIIIECSKLAKKEYKTRRDWCGQRDPLGDVEEIEI